MIEKNKVEIRVSTFRQHALLERALVSLQNQTHCNWMAIVFEDSPENCGKHVVQMINDQRISYVPCSRNLGLVGNLSRCFSSSPYAVGSSFACVLEDDNYYYPGFLENALGKIGVFDVLLCNAQISQLYQDGREILQDRYTMSAIYGGEYRAVSLEERLSKFSDSCVVGNLCLFWKIGEKVDFSIPNERNNQIVQEKMRAVSYRGDFIFDPKPLAVWNNFADRSLIGKSKRENRLWRSSEIRMCNEILDLIQEENISTLRTHEVYSYFLENSSKIRAFMRLTNSSERRRVARNMITRLAGR
jgi:glycosyltransferase involved in cell wall biosynthesis